jgi:hypothetical protein
MDRGGDARVHRLLILSHRHGGEGTNRYAEKDTPKSFHVWSLRYKPGAVKDFN